MNAAEILKDVISALELAQKLSGLGGPNAAAALLAVDTAIGHIISGAKGETDSGTMFARIIALDGAVQIDDDKADAAADAKK